MNTEDRQESVFGAFDGSVSIVGLVFGLLLHHSTHAAIAAGGFGAAISAALSMSAGEVVKSGAAIRSRLLVASAMLSSTLIGSLLLVWPFAVPSFSTGSDLALAALGAILVAVWIAVEKGGTLRSWVETFGILFGVAGLTLLLTWCLPQTF
jgi:hypothetical protein